MRIPKLALLLLLALMMPLLHSDEKKAKDITGFVITKSSNSSAKIKSKDGKYQKLEINKFYEFPCTIRSNRAQIVLQFSELNTAKLLPNTTLVLHSPKVKHPKLKLIKGKVSIQLDRFPKDHKMEVTTPTAVCGAVGTHFEVSYDTGEEKRISDRSQSQSFKCTKGEVYISSNSFKIEGVKAGYEVASENHDGRSNAYCRVELKPKEKGTSFRLQLPDKTQLVSDREGSFEIAHTKDKALSVVKFKDGNFEEEGILWDSKIDAKNDTAYVKVGDKLVEHADTDAYLTAAKNEGRIQTRITEIEQQLEIESSRKTIKALKKEKDGLAPQLEQAEKAANEIAKRFEQNQNIRRMIQKIRQNIQRQNRQRIPRR